MHHTASVRMHCGMSGMQHIYIAATCAEMSTHHDTQGAGTITIQIVQLYDMS